MIDLVLLEQEFHALGQAVDGVILLTHHFLEVQRQLADLDAHIGEILVGFFIKLGRVQHRLGRNAAHIQAGAAQRLARLDTGRLQTQLACADGAVIAAGAAADNHHIILICHGVHRHR